MDIYQIFRDFSRDENDPSNYDFVLTDQYLTAIHESGAETVYRLGTSIEHIREHGCPLDFFSYHYYGNQPEVQHTIAEYVRKNLDDAGYPHAVMVLDEWNGSFRTPQEFADMRSMIGARFVGKMFCAFQNTCVDIATYYDGQPHMKWCGLFNRDVVKQKPYFVFKMFGRLYRLKERVALSVSGGGITALAAEDGLTAGIFLINDGEEQMLSLAGRDNRLAEMTVTDEADDKRTVSGIPAGEPMLIPARSVVYLELKPTDRV